MAGLTATGGEDITLAPTRPNAGTEAAYRKRLDALICGMHNSVVYWISAKYRANPPEMAQDASPAATLRSAMAGLARRWNKRFREAAPQLAEWFATAATERSDASLRSILRKSGFSVRFTMTREMNDVFSATVGEQVGETFVNGRDNRGLMTIDKDTEEFVNVSAPIAGLDELQAQAQEHMSGVSGIPLVKLFGITPSGLNASSDGEVRCFYDWIRAQQEDFFTDTLKRTLEIIQLSEFGEIDPDIEAVYERSPGSDGAEETSPGGEDEIGGDGADVLE